MFQLGGPGETHQTAVLEVPGYAPDCGARGTGLCSRLSQGFLACFLCFVVVVFLRFRSKKTFISRNIVPYCFTLLVYSVYLLHY